jgi:hypothetical protein
MRKKTQLSVTSIFGLAVCLMMGSCIHESITEEAVQPVEEMNLSVEELILLDDEIGANLRKNPSDQNQLLASIRAATAKYHRLSVAEADGYVLDPHCVAVPGLGGMGHHAVNMGKIGPFVNPTDPGVLVYEPMKNGGYKLGAVEYLVPAEPWDESNDGPPMLGEIPFDDHREVDVDEEGKPFNVKGGPPFPHYQLHVWLWTNNPSGMYFPFNPKVSCN